MNRLQAYLLSALLAFGAAAQAQQGRPNVPSTPGAGAQVLPDFADLVEKYGPAVVNINTETRMAARQASRSRGRTKLVWTPKRGRV